MGTKDILTKTVLFGRRPAFLNARKTHDYTKFGKEVKTNIVVDISLHSLSIHGFQGTDFRLLQ